MTLAQITHPIIQVTAIAMLSEVIIIAALVIAITTAEIADEIVDEIEIAIADTVKSAKL